METIKTSGIKVEILNVETVASNITEGRKNLARHMEGNREIARLYVQRPRGRKIGMITVFDSGNISKIYWMDI